MATDVKVGQIWERLHPVSPPDFRVTVIEGGRKCSSGPKYEPCDDCINDVAAKVMVTSVGGDGIYPPLFYIFTACMDKFTLVKDIRD